MRALVFGVGRMGLAISWAMNQLGFKVYGVDVSEDTPKGCPLWWMILNSIR